MRFPCARAPDQHHILSPIQEFTAMELANQSFPHFTGREIEGRQILVSRKAGSLHVIRGRLHLSFGHFGLEELRQDRRRAGGTLSA
jgi:hypothetical protein